MPDRSLGLITVKELADELQVPVSWVYGETRKIGPDAMPRLKVGKYLRFRLDEVMDWLRKRNGQLG